MAAGCPARAALRVVAGDETGVEATTVLDQSGDVLEDVAESRTARCFHDGFHAPRTRSRVQAIEARRIVEIEDTPPQPAGAAQHHALAKLLVRRNCLVGAQGFEPWTR